MTDVRHRDVWRVWYTLDGSSTEIAHLLYAVDEVDALQRGELKLAKELPNRVVTIIKAEKR